MPGYSLLSDVVTIPMGTMSFLLSGFRPISYTSVLSQVYELLVSSRSCAFKESEGVFPSHQYAYCEALGTCVALSDMVERDKLTM